MNEILNGERIQITNTFGQLNLVFWNSINDDLAHNLDAIMKVVNDGDLVANVSIFPHGSAGGRPETFHGCDWMEVDLVDGWGPCLFLQNPRMRDDHNMKKFVPLAPDFAERDLGIHPSVAPTIQAISLHDPRVGEMKREIARLKAELGELESRPVIAEPV